MIHELAYLAWLMATRSNIAAVGKNFRLIKGWIYSFRIQYLDSL